MTGASALPDRWICLDVGETLIDETRIWSTWADVVGVPRMTFMAAFGAAVARGQEHQGVFSVLGITDWRSRLAEVQRRYGGFQVSDLYPDAVPAISALRELGMRVSVIGNQPAERTAELRALGIDTDVMAMSDEMGVAKPDPRFFHRALELMGRPDPAMVAYVGDRPDNDVRPSAAAGMRAVWLRRGPWGVIAPAPPEALLQVDSLTELVHRLAEVWTDGPAAVHRGVADARVGYAAMSSPASANQSSQPFRSVRAAVREAVEVAWVAAVRSGALPPIPVDADVPVVEVSHSSDPAHGDIACSLALKLARPLRRPPMAIADAIAAELHSSIGRHGPLCEVQVAAPGFLNMRFAPGYLERTLDSARAAGDTFGRVHQETPRKLNVEFVSANPTGPLTVGNARGAFVGDLLCRVLEAAGDDVTREYYFNDSGRQVRILGASVAARRSGDELPDEAYRGAYVDTLAAELPDAIWTTASAPGSDRDAIVGAWASERIRSGIEASLAHLGVQFDVWTSEASLHADGWVERAVERLRTGGHVFEQDGATWFRSTDFGDDKDRVIYRTTGEPTYFAADIGYVTEKFSRGFSKLIYIWGADHHGTVARVRNAAKAMGFDMDAVEMLLVAWVRFVRDGLEVSMSKRAGEFITLDELLAEVGVDAARWSFAARAPSSPIDFDIELARKQSAENPVYYVQYAHARICSILRKAAEAGIEPSPTLEGALGDDQVAAGLARDVLRLPEVVEDAAAAEETHAVTAYATGLATTFHAFYRDRRVVDAADLVTSAHRLALVDTARLALRNTLGLLGISTPEQM